MKNIYLDFLSLCSHTYVYTQEKTMIHIEQMSKEEYEEFNRHNILHDMAELVLQYGYDEIMSDLANILDSKLDKLEPC